MKPHLFLILIALVGCDSASDDGVFEVVRYTGKAIDHDEANHADLSWSVALTEPIINGPLHVTLVRTQDAHGTLDSLVLLHYEGSELPQLVGHWITPNSVDPRYLSEGKVSISDWELQSGGVVSGTIEGVARGVGRRLDSDYVGKVNEVFWARIAE